MVAAGKISIYVNPDSDVFNPFRSMLVVDDDPDDLNVIGLSTTEENKNILIACCPHPDLALKVMGECFCDMGVFDMNLPGMSGDKLVKKAKAISNLMVAMAMTGYEDEYEYKAGNSNPYIYVRKSAGINALKEGIAGCVQEAGRRLGAASEKYKEYFVKDLPWNKVMEFKEHFGFTPAQYLLSRKKMKAVALMKIRPHASLGEIADWAGFETSTHMKEELKNILPLIDFSAPAGG